MLSIVNHTADHHPLAAGTKLCVCVAAYRADGVPGRWAAAAAVAAAEEAHVVLAAPCCLCAATWPPQLLKLEVNGMRLFCAACGGIV